MRLKYARNLRTLDFSPELLSLTKDYENVSSVNDSGCVSTKERQTGNRRSPCSTSTPVNPSAGNGHRDSLSQFLPCNHCHLRHPFIPSLILILSPGRTWRSPSPRRSVFELFSLYLFLGLFRFLFIPRPSSRTLAAASHHGVKFIVIQWNIWENRPVRTYSYAKVLAHPRWWSHRDYQSYFWEIFPREVI